MALVLIEEGRTNRVWFRLHDSASVSALLRRFRSLDSLLTRSPSQLCPSLVVSTPSSHGPHLSCVLPWSSQPPPHTVPISDVAFPGRLNSLFTRSPSQLCPSLVVSTPSSHGPHLRCGLPWSSQPPPHTVPISDVSFLLSFVFGAVPPRLSLQVFFLRNLAASIVRENCHQVGSILSETNFIITQLAMFYLLLRFDHLLQELNVQWSLLARWRGEQTVPHVT